MTRLQKPYGDAEVVEDHKHRWRLLVENHCELKASPLYRTLWVKPLPRRQMVETLLPYRRWLQTVSLGCSRDELAGLTALSLSFIHSFQKIYLKMALALCLFGTGYLLIGFSSVAWTICLYLFLAGAALAVVNTLALGLFQYYVPDAMKGRFFAMMTTVCFAAIPVSYILTGYLSKHIIAERLFMMNGFMIVLMGLLLSLLPRAGGRIGS
jgi:hypothetical protein